MLSYKFQNETIEDEFDSTFNDKPKTNNFSKFNEDVDN